MILLPVSMGPWRHPIYLIYTSGPFRHMVICSKFELFRIQNCRGSLFFNPSSFDLCPQFNRKNGYVACILISMNGCMYKCHKCCFVEGCGLLHYVLRNGNLTITSQPWMAQRNEGDIVQSWDRTFVLLLIFCAST
jgi:hypothetical protein